MNAVMKEVMVDKDGKQVEITPYDWIYVRDGLPLLNGSQDSRRACYVCFTDGKTAKAYYTGHVMDTWVSQDKTNIALNENEIVAWRYQAPA